MSQLELMAAAVMYTKYNCKSIDCRTTKKVHNIILHCLTWSQMIFFCNWIFPQYFHFDFIHTYICSLYTHNSLYIPYTRM
jgi:hypothetical protein